MFDMMQVKVFGTLVKGLRTGMDLLLVLQNEEHIKSLLLKIFYFPERSGHDTLSEFLHQFEATIDSDFPKYQVSFFLINSYPDMLYFGRLCKSRC